jgi:hypothetical protein
MNNDINDEEIRTRKSRIDRILTQETMALIQQGIEAYKRDLPQLLEANEYGHMVAYEADKQVALAPTDRKLKKILAGKNLVGRADLFITYIAPLDGEDDNGYGF